MEITNISIRKILNSGGKPAIEATVVLGNQFTGVASAPSAIIAGKREVTTTNFQELENDVLETMKEDLIHHEYNQKDFDNILDHYMDSIGSDICLSLSLAFARAKAKETHQTLVEYIENETNIKSDYKAPCPLVAIFSGGVHGQKDGGSLQQIMLSVNEDDFNTSIGIILNIYNDIEKYLKEHDMFAELGNSSGFVVKNISIDEQFNLLSQTIKKYNYDNVSIAIDVAAEHLVDDHHYLYQNKTYTEEEFFQVIQDYKDKYPITFIEDPFDSDSKDAWIRFQSNNKDIDVVGDDLFATQSKYLNKEEANAMIIKMNQAGNLTNTLKTIIAAKQQGIKLCVSHRSYETEDTFMCDLAVATNSEYIKIGGPRRGDRIAKYNRMLKLVNISPSK